MKPSEPGDLQLSISARALPHSSIEMRPFHFPHLLKFKFKFILKNYSYTRNVYNEHYTSIAMLIGACCVMAYVALCAHSKTSNLFISWSSIIILRSLLENLQNYI